MKAIVYHKGDAGDVLKLDEVERTVPKDDQVLLKVRAASVNPLDYHLLRHPFLRRMMRGKIDTARPGRDVAGHVEAVGHNVTHFKSGDEIFGAAPGAFAEFTCAGESDLALKPNGVSFEQVASTPIAGLTALQALRDKGQLQPGQKVLINGASGGVGTFAVQIAKWLGAEVTGVCSSRNLELVRSLGADHVIDYTQGDIASLGQQYDLFFDLVANQSFSKRRSVLTEKGRYVGAGMLGVKLSLIRVAARGIAEFVKSSFVSQSFGSFMANMNQKDLATIAELIKEGTITPVIDRRYSLSETAEAVQYVELGHARGKVIIDLNQE